MTNEKPFSCKKHGTMSAYTSERGHYCVMCAGEETEPSEQKKDIRSPRNEIDRLSREINMTPSGEKRNKLTEQLILETMSEPKKPLTDDLQLENILKSLIKNGKWNEKKWKEVVDNPHNARKGLVFPYWDLMQFFLEVKSLANENFKARIQERIDVLDKEMNIPETSITEISVIKIVIDELKKMKAGDLI